MIISLRKLLKYTQRTRHLLAKIMMSDEENNFMFSKELYKIMIIIIVVVNTPNFLTISRKFSNQMCKSQIFILSLSDDIINQPKRKLFKLI